MPEFIIDTQLPPKLALFLSGKGYNAIHTSRYPNGHLMKDSQIIDIAKSEGKIIITKDSDFLDYFIMKGAPPKVFLIQLGNITNNELITMIDRNLDEIISSFEINELVIINRTRIIKY